MEQEKIYTVKYDDGEITGNLYFMCRIANIMYFSAEYEKTQDRQICADGILKREWLKIMDVIGDDLKKEVKSK